MKKILTFGFLLTVLCGCNTTSVTITSPQGQVSKIVNSRFAWSTDSYDWSYSTNGTWHATANKSGPDANTVNAFASIVGAALAAKP